MILSNANYLSISFNDAETNIKFRSHLPECLNNRKSFRRALQYRITSRQTLTHHQLTQKLLYTQYLITCQLTCPWI